MKTSAQEFFAIRRALDMRPGSMKAWQEQGALDSHGWQMTSPNYADKVRPCTSAPGKTME